MSDSEGDFSDELLELAGATERKRKRRQDQSALKAKRRRPDAGSDFDEANTPESEEEQENSNPYPLDGKYMDELDRQRLLEMPEIEREGILAQRQEEMQRILDKRNLEQMLKAQQNGGMDSGAVAKAAKRQHAVRGATKEKTLKLDELKAKRKAKDERKRTKSSPKRERSSSPMDMGTSSEEEGMITREEQIEERERKMYDRAHPVDEPVTMDDLSKCRLTRDTMAKLCMTPWFDEYIKGAWCRYLIGQENDQPVYRICEIQSLGADLVKPYKLNNETVNQNVELKHGSSVKSFPMDKISNSDFQQKEWDRLIKVYEAEKLKLPTKRQLQKKAEQISKLAQQSMTEADITAMLARRKELQNGRQSTASITMERSRLTQARTLASRRQDYKEVAEIDVKLEEIAALVARAKAVRGREEADNLNDVLARVNERNRKANLEAVRRAELAEAERKRKERKLALANRSGANTPVADPNARLKPGALKANANSRPGTPNVVNSGSPEKDASPNVSPLPPSALTHQDPVPIKSGNFQDSVIASLDIDLGDF